MRKDKPKNKHAGIWNVSTKAIEGHMALDVDKHNANVRSGKPLCPRCEGTGNEFLSMYKECTLCLGTGVLRKPA